MPQPESFLVIDDNADSRFLLVKTLLRKFPRATIQECYSADKAIDYARRHRLSAIITHRTTEMAGLAVLRRLRETCPTTPVVMVSSIDRKEAALAAGAAAFLLYDEWLRIGTIVTALLAAPADPKSKDPDVDDTPSPAPAGTK